jgi:hypothetical protein
VNRLRLVLALAGFALAGVSVALDDARMGWGAIALLTSSLAVRMVQRKREKRNREAQH